MSWLCSRERNRLHARKSRARKKVFVESLRSDAEAFTAEWNTLRRLCLSVTGVPFRVRPPVQTVSESFAASDVEQVELVKSCRPNQSSAHERFLLPVPIATHSRPCCCANHPRLPLCDCRMRRRRRALLDSCLRTETRMGMQRCVEYPGRDGSAMLGQPVSRAVLVKRALTCVVSLSSVCAGGGRRFSSRRTSTGKQAPHGSRGAQVRVSVSAPSVCAIASMFQCSIQPTVAARPPLIHLISRCQSSRPGGTGRITR